MARKKTAEPQPIAPEDESQEQPEEGGGQEGHGKISKVDAIRRAITDGYDSPKNGPDYIKSTFGIEVSKAHFSATKSNLKKRDGAGIKVAVKRGRKPKEAASPAHERESARPAKVSAAANGDGELLAALEAMKPLVASMGADKVRRLVDLLG